MNGEGDISLWNQICSSYKVTWVKDTHRLPLTGLSSDGQLHFFTVINFHFTSNSGATSNLEGSALVHRTNIDVFFRKTL